MKLRQVFLSAFAATAVWLAAGSTVWSQSAEPPVPSAAPSAPPVAPVRAVTDDYHGTKVVDPYRYMEDLKDPEVQVWFKGQNNYTRAALQKCPDWRFWLEELPVIPPGVRFTSSNRI